MNWDAYFDATLAYITISREDAEAWRKGWMDEKAAYIQHKIDNGLYSASLTKQGPGQMVLTGDNTYAGGTTVEAGELGGWETLEMVQKYAHFAPSHIAAHANTVKFWSSSERTPLARVA
jgi:autotransporter-associated beta strand protein